MLKDELDGKLEDTQVNCECACAFECTSLRVCLLALGCVCVTYALAHAVCSRCKHSLTYHSPRVVVIYGNAQLQIESLVLPFIICCSSMSLGIEVLCVDLNSR